jgi:hypothetical protein
MVLPSPWELRLRGSQGSESPSLLGSVQPSSSSIHMLLLPLLATLQPYRDPKRHPSDLGASLASLSSLHLNGSSGREVSSIQEGGASRHLTFYFTTSCQAVRGARPFLLSHCHCHLQLRQLDLRTAGDSISILAVTHVHCVTPYPPTTTTPPTLALIVHNNRNRLY